jgi:glycosyltransferase involved in cell wall biosynthesis
MNARSARHNRTVTDEMRRMRIIFSYPWRLDDLGGSQISVPLLAEALIRRGHQVGIVEATTVPSVKVANFFSGQLWTVPKVHPSSGPWAWQGVRHSITHPRRILRSATAEIGSWRTVLQSIADFRQILRSFDPDIVSVQCPWRQAPSAVGAHLFPHQWRLVVTVRSPGDVRASAGADAWLRVWQRRLFARADAVTLVSDALRRELVALYTVAGRRSRVIHNGVDPSWFSPPAGAPRAVTTRYALFVGRLDQSKGVDVLLHAWRQVRARGNEIALCLAGDGPEAARLSELAQQLHLAPDVKFLGRIAPDALRVLYRDAELVVVPSPNDECPPIRVALEAGASSAICVATSVGGIPEIIDHAVTGFLVEPDSSNALASAILRAVELPAAERIAMKAAARKRIAGQFSHDRTADAFEDLFSSLLAAPRGPRR